MPHLVSQKSMDGPQSSRTGISTTRTALSGDQIDRGLEWLRRLPKLPAERLPAKDEIERIAGKLMEPASAAWCMARVAALLNPYYDKDTPQSVRVMEAEDWREALARFPDWAIERAARWWKSADNPDRRKRPLEGDIAARCLVEMNGVFSAVEIAERRRSGREFATDAPRDRISKGQDERARADEIVRLAGFAPRRIPPE